MRPAATPREPEPSAPAIRSLHELRSAEAECTRCPLYRDAIQVVPGEGSSKASMMLVGEQPGDREDIEGKPFVGPAGRILDRALSDAGIDRESVFITNAVKHFKHEMRGKRRLHKKPNAYEIDRCRWWLDLERALIRPPVVVAMGATAVRGVYGRAATIGNLRGQRLLLPDGAHLVVTIHPSYLLRIRESGEWQQEYTRFIRDLKTARAAASRPLATRA